MIVAVISRKGGVGKTTSVVSLAGALARLGKRVLVVDLDSQASASLSLGVARGRPRAVDPRRPLPLRSGSEAIRPTVDREGRPASPPPPTSCTPTSSSRRCAIARAKLREVLAPVVGAYDWILLDCPPSFNTLAQAR